MFQRETKTHRIGTAFPGGIANTTALAVSPITAADRELSELQLLFECPVATFTKHEGCGEITPIPQGAVYVQSKEEGH